MGPNVNFNANLICPNAMENQVNSLTSYNNLIDGGNKKTRPVQ